MRARPLVGQGLVTVKDLSAAISIPATYHKCTNHTSNPLKRGTHQQIVDHIVHVMEELFRQQYFLDILSIYHRYIVTAPRLATRRKINETLFFVSNEYYKTGMNILLA